MNGYIKSQVSFIQSGNRSGYKNLKITKVINFRTFDCDVVWQTFDDQKFLYLSLSCNQAVIVKITFQCNLISCLQISVFVCMCV